MRRQFEFRIKGNEIDFVEFLESNNIPYSRLPEELDRIASIGSSKKRDHNQIATARSREKEIANIQAKAFTVDGITLDVFKTFFVTLTPFLLARLWDWYKTRRKRKDSQLFVVYTGNALDLDAKSMRILMSVLKEASKRKTRKKRGK